MKIKNVALFSFLLLSGIACAQKPDSDISRIIKERTGREVRLLTGGEDAEAGTIVHRLLHHDLTADNAAQIALLNNRSLQAMLEEIGISQADLHEAGLLKNPEFSGNARFPDRPSLVTDMEGSLAQDFLDLLVLPLRKRVAAAQLAQTKLRVANEVLDLVASTKIAFYELQAQMQLLGRMKLILDTNQAAIELSQKQHEAGNITDLMLANQQATYSQSRLEVSMVEAEIREKREHLNRLMGVWGMDTGWKAASDLPRVPDSDFPTRGLESVAVSQRLDLAAAHEQLVSIVKALGLTRRYRFVGALELGIDTERNSDRSTVTGPTLRVELPVFNQGQARIEKMEAQLRQSERRFEALAIEIRSDVREKRDQLIAKRDVAKFYHDELLPERLQIFQLTQLQYNGMLVGLFELLLAKQNELNAERGYVESTRDYWITRTELERAIGGTVHPRNPRSKLIDVSKDIKTSNQSSQ